VHVLVVEGGGVSAAGYFVELGVTPGAIRRVSGCQRLRGGRLERLRRPRRGG